MTPVDQRPILLHALENDARVERGAFNCREQLVFRRMRQIPAKRDAAQLRIHQHRAVAVVPGQPQQARLAGAVVCRARPQAARHVVPARRAIASKISPTAESPASMPV